MSFASFWQFQSKPLQYLWGVLIVCTALLLVGYSIIAKRNSVQSYMTYGVIEDVNSMRFNKIDLPFVGSPTPAARFVTYKIVLDKNYIGSKHWNIVVDDCVRGITINKVPIDLQFAQGNLCDYTNGITLDLTPYFIPDSKNTILISAEDMGGAFGLDIRSDLGYLYYFHGAFVAIFLFASSLLLRHQKVGIPAIALFVASAVISAHYLHISSNSAWTHDVEYHINYIYHVMSNWLNPYGFSMQSNHPPFYYYVAGVILKLNDALLHLPHRTALRALSWMFFMVFNFYAILTLKHLQLSNVAYYSALLALLMWPGSMHMASKINSEAMYYALYASSFYYLIRWSHACKTSDLVICVLLAAINLMVRANGVILCVLILLVAAHALLTKKISIRTFFTMRWIPIYIVVAGCITVLFGDIIFSHSRSVMDAVGVFDRFKVSTYQYLTLKYDISVPFNNWINQGFLEFLIRTSLFSEYGDWPAPEFGVAINCFAVAMFWYAVLPWLFAKPEQWKGVTIHALNFVISIAFLLYFLYNVKDSSGQDVRYIYPAYIMFVASLFGKSQQMHSQRHSVILAWAGPLLAVGMSMLSAYYFWNYSR